MAGLYIQVPSSSGESEYIFLCSATFIQNDWLVIPAHCILDPEMTKKDLQEFLQDKQQSEPAIEENNIGNIIHIYSFDESPFVAHSAVHILHSAMVVIKSLQIHSFNSC